MKRVLVVDDNMLIGKLVAMYLCEFGWRVETCYGPEGMTRTVKEFKPDVVLLDLNMPGLSVDEFAGLLDQKNKPISFKLISFSAEAESIQRDMVNTGMFEGYFVKSQSLADLKELIENISM